MSRLNPFKQKKNMQHNHQEPQNKDVGASEHIIDEAAINFNADDSLAGSTHLNDELSGEESNIVGELEQKLKEANDRYLRSVAEFDNYRKRTAKEKIELGKTAGEEVIKPLLDVLDDSERARKQMETSDDLNQIKEGINLVFNKLAKSLDGRGLKAMESKGLDFDPELHEAIAEVPAPTPDLVGKVLDEVQKGYYLNDKIIRHAKVVVGK
ncbi:MAG: nucleotide exchange factor GrpE [Edaphocola sp.]